MSLTKMIRKLPMFKAMDRMEDELHAREDVVHPAEDSPERFEIVREKIKRGGDGPPSQMALIMIPTLMGIIKSLKSLKDKAVFKAESDKYYSLSPTKYTLEYLF